MWQVVSSIPLVILKYLMISPLVAIKNIGKQKQKQIHRKGECVSLQMTHVNGIDDREKLQKMKQVWLFREVWGVPLPSPTVRHNAIQS